MCWYDEKLNRSVSTVTGADDGRDSVATGTPAEGADLVELRLDTVDRPDAAGRSRPPRPGHRDLPCRVGGRALRRAPKRSGGASSSTRSRSAPSSSTSRRRPLRTRSDPRTARPRRDRLVITISTGAREPGGTAGRRCESTGAEVAKIAVAVNSLSETLRSWPWPTRLATTTAMAGSGTC